MHNESLNTDKMWSEIVCKVGKGVNKVKTCKVFSNPEGCKDLDHKWNTCYNF